MSKNLSAPKVTPVEDDEILDLLEVVQAGKPVSMPPKSEPSELEAELDALLDDSLPSQASDSRFPDPTPVDHKVDPDEALQMPNMEDFDSLLASLGATSESQTSSKPLETTNSLDVDDDPDAIPLDLAESVQASETSQKQISQTAPAPKSKAVVPPADPFEAAAAQVKSKAEVPSADPFEAAAAQVQSKAEAPSADPFEASAAQVKSKAVVPPADPFEAAAAQVKSKAVEAPADPFEAAAAQVKSKAVVPPADPFEAAAAQVQSKAVEAPKAASKAADPALDNSPEAIAKAKILANLQKALEEAPEDFSEEIAEKTSEEVSANIPVDPASEALDDIFEQAQKKSNATTVPKQEELLEVDSGLQAKIISVEESEPIAPIIPLAQNASIEEMLDSVQPTETAVNDQNQANELQATQATEIPLDDPFEEASLLAKNKLAQAQETADSIAHKVAEDMAKDMDSVAVQEGSLGTAPLAIDEKAVGEQGGAQETFGLSAKDIDDGLNLHELDALLDDVLAAAPASGTSCLSVPELAAVQNESEQKIVGDLTGMDILGEQSVSKAPSLGGIEASIAALRADITKSVSEELASMRATLESLVGQMDNKAVVNLSSSTEKADAKDESTSASVGIDELAEIKAELAEQKASLEEMQSNFDMLNANLDKLVAEAAIRVIREEILAMIKTL